MDFQSPVCCNLEGYSETYQDFDEVSSRWGALKICVFFTVGRKSLTTESRIVPMSFGRNTEKQLKKLRGSVSHLSRCFSGVVCSARRSTTFECSLPLVPYTRDK